MAHGRVLCRKLQHEKGPLRPWWRCQEGRGTDTKTKLQRFVATTSRKFVGTLTSQKHETCIKIQNHHRISLSKSCIDSHGSLDGQLLRHHRCQNQYTPHVVHAVGHSLELEMSPQVVSTFPCSSENVWTQVPIILRMWRLDYFRSQERESISRDCARHYRSQGVWNHP